MTMIFGMAKTRMYLLEIADIGGTWCYHSDLGIGSHTAQQVGKPVFCYNDIVGDLHKVTAGFSAWRRQGYGEIPALPGKRPQKLYRHRIPHRILFADHNNILLLM
mgnify:CR=1 FL=1